MKEVTHTSLQTREARMKLLRVVLIALAVATVAACGTSTVTGPDAPRVDKSVMGSGG